jgi:hypothetical protein
MRFLLLALVALAPSITQAERPEQPYITTTGVSGDLGTAKWLRESCAAAVSLYASEDAELNEKQAQGFATALVMIKGMMDGLNKAVWLYEPENAPALLFTPDKWSGFDVIAPSILSFMQRHSDKISDETPAAEVVAAWYF